MKRNLALKNFSNFILVFLLSFSITFAKNEIVPSINHSYINKSLKTRFKSWGIDPKYPASINLVNAWKIFKKKDEIVVAVVDTGIHFEHDFLNENIITKEESKTASSKNFGIDVSVKSKNITPKDTHGHGTHVSGIIKSIFPEVKLLSIKYYNPMHSGVQNLASTIKALEYAVDQNVDIINYSGGGPEASAEELAILKKALEKNILVIAAAGNESSDIDSASKAYYPASYGLPNIISVAAHDQSAHLIASSNWGPNSVDVAAPGHEIESAFPNNGVGIMTGTSQATAFVTGVASLIKSNYKNLSAAEIKNIIVASSIELESLKKRKLVNNKIKLEKALIGGKLDSEKALLKAKEVSEKLISLRRFSKNKSREIAQNQN